MRPFTCHGGGSDRSSGRRNYVFPWLIIDVVVAAVAAASSYYSSSSSSSRVDLSLVGIDSLSKFFGDAYW